MTTPTLSRRAALLLGASAVLLPGQALPQDDPRDVEGGIGGTGIVGVLTDFGSLIVGGEYVRTDRNTRYSDGYGRLSKSALAVGDSLTVEADGPSSALIARRVHVTHPLVGTITAARGRTIVVNGVQVRLRGSGAGFSVGDRVAVSGLWRGDVVEASRLSRARDARDLVAGDVSGAVGQKRIGSVSVTGAGVARRENGSFATAVGQFTDGQLRAARVTAGRFTGASRPLVWLSVEGYLTPTQERPGYRVSGLGHSFARDLQLGPLAGGRLLLNGRYTGLFDASEARSLPDDFSGQRRVLNRISRSDR